MKKKCDSSKTFHVHIFVIAVGKSRKFGGKEFTREITSFPSLKHMSFCFKGLSMYMETILHQDTPSESFRTLEGKKNNNNIPQASRQGARYCRGGNYKVLHTGSRINITLHFSTATQEVRKQWRKALKCWGK